MTIFRNFKIAYLLTVSMICFNAPVFCQDDNNFEYLISCFGKSTTDTSELEIKGIGNVLAISLNSSEMEETALTYYDIPQNKRNKSSSKLCELSSDMQVQTWKNNSRTIVNDKYKAGKASVIDLRLHMLIENIYLQVITICDKDRIYEIMCFRDTNDISHFDSLIKKIEEKSCLQ